MEATAFPKTAAAGVFGTSNSISDDIDALWDSCVSSLIPTDGDLTSTAQAWVKATDYLQPRRLEETNTLSNPPEDVVNAVSLLHELGMIQGLLDWHSGMLEAVALLGEPN